MQYNAREGDAPVFDTIKDEMTFIRQEIDKELKDQVLSSPENASSLGSGGSASRTKEREAIKEALHILFEKKQISFALKKPDGEFVENISSLSTHMESKVNKYVSQALTDGIVKTVYEVQKKEPNFPFDIFHDVLAEKIFAEQIKKKKKSFFSTISTEGIGVVVGSVAVLVGVGFLFRSNPFILAISIGVSVFVFVVWYEYLQNQKKTRDAIDYRLLRVVVKRADEGQGGTDKIKLFEQLIDDLVILDSEHITFEVAVANSNNDIVFYCIVPTHYIKPTRDTIHRIFTTAQVIEVPDYTPFREGNNDMGAALIQKKHFALPLRTYTDTNQDIFSSVLNVFARAQQDNVGLALQMCIRPARQRQKEMLEIIKSMEHKTPFKVAASLSFGDYVYAYYYWTTELLFGGKKELSSTDAEYFEKIKKKKDKHLYDINMRLVISTEDPLLTQRIFENIYGEYKQFSIPGYNSFVLEKRKTKPFFFKYIFRLFDENELLTLNTEEIASVFHLPNVEIQMQDIKHLKSRKLSAPSDLPITGLLMGDNEFNGVSKEVRIEPPERLRHLYIIGQTGTGKTAFMNSAVMQDIQEGRGVCVLEPNGDFIEKIMSTIPEHRLDDVIVFDPSNVAMPMGLNMLEYDRSRPEQRTFIVNEMISIFRTLFSAETMGPFFDQYMRNALLLLMEGSVDEYGTLVEVPSVLINADYRKKLLANCKNDTVRRFWIEEAEKVKGDLSLEETAPYITSKINGFIANDYIFPIIGQSRSSINFRDIMDNKKILLGKLSKGRIGEINANLIGMMITGKLTLAAFSRDDIPENDRVPFYFYIDEFQNFTTKSIGTILSEARKYRLSLTVAHQYMKQLPEDILAAVLGNVGSFVSFRIGIEDADIIKKQFGSEVDSQDLTELENLNGFVRYLVRNAPTKPFSMKIRFAPDGIKEVRDIVVKYSSLKYARPLEEVLVEIKERLNPSTKESSKENTDIPDISKFFE
ncbi:MAG: hypothetical protein QM526_00630 [Alphaproteobacteria bacterium]|nr:hypothetical protein [Alphaproteobacteria bacterium]